MEDNLVGGAGEAYYLSNAASYILGGFDGGDDVFFGTLEELAYVGEGVVLTEEGEEAGVGYSLWTLAIIEHPRVYG